MTTIPEVLVISSRNVILPGFEQPQAATIRVDVHTGIIVDILQQYLRDEPSGHHHLKTRWINAGDQFVLPGLVDTHVHLQEPGQTDWEGFWTGTRAAISGGVTTLVDMPLDCLPPTTTVANLQMKKEAAEGQCWSDIAFWGGIIPGNQAELKPMADGGVKGFKCFLIDTGTDEFPWVSESELRTHMEELKDTPTVLLFHAELENPSLTGCHPQKYGDPTVYQTYLDSRPEEMEVAAISMIVRLQQEYPSLHCHIAHLSASTALPLIQTAKRRGSKLTVETCPHYLSLSATPRFNRHPEFKCSPPIREDQNREKLWDALIDGTIDCVASDHSPCALELKKLEEGDIMGAMGGIHGLGLGLSLLWTEGKKRGVSLAQIVRWTSEKTAQLAGLSASKGGIKVGLDGDLVIWDPNAEFEVSKKDLHFKNKLSPYEGMGLRGVVHQTFLRGRLVYDRKQNGFDGLEPVGNLL
ncbi:allantoinase [Leucogyrophana mollusca]|uniref:Allantoinase n=1 Tax=Leucogyrophana mollusca TaxID=85980 RepID=A0ACB8BJ87_9AGAM|nr:allantoinase [Leucogyrophana mollusca]